MPDPALVIYSEHAAYFWRAWTAAYLGAMVGFAAWLVAGRHEAQADRREHASSRAVTVAESGAPRRAKAVACRSGAFVETRQRSRRGSSSS